MSWFLACSPPMDGAANMALDAALLARARRTGDTVVRVYTWSAPTLSLGRNQRAAGVYDLAAIAREGVGVVRRPTGGRALLHHRELTYSVTAPVDGLLGATFHRINALLVHALGALGATVRVAHPGTPTPPPGPMPCFAEPAAGELVAGGRKLVGSAQWRDDGALLQHGSILVDDDQGRIASLMAPGATGVAAAAPATLRALLGRAPAASELADSLMGAVRALEDPSARELVLDDALLAEARALEEHFRGDAWTWRR